jgi:hypothetical protein
MASDLDIKPPAASKEDGDAPIVLSEQARRRQKLRSVAIAWALFALVALFFIVTIVRLGANVANRPL